MRLLRLNTVSHSPKNRLFWWPDERDQRTEGSDLPQLVGLVLSPGRGQKSSRGFFNEREGTAKDLLYAEVNAVPAPIKTTTFLSHASAQHPDEESIRKQ